MLAHLFYIQVGVVSVVFFSVGCFGCCFPPPPKRRLTMPDLEDCLSVFVVVYYFAVLIIGCCCCCWHVFCCCFVGVLVFLVAVSKILLLAVDERGEAR